MTAIAAIRTTLATIDRSEFRTFPQFEAACMTNPASDLPEILEAAKASGGSVSSRISYAFRLALHADENPLER